MLKTLLTIGGPLRRGRRVASFSVRPWTAWTAKRRPALRRPTSWRRTETRTARTAGRRSWRSQFVAIQLAIGVLVELLQRLNRIGELLGGDFAVSIGVECGF